MFELSGAGRAQQSERDDAHGFLRIIGAVHNAHGSGAENLCHPKEAVHPLRAPIVKGEIKHGHDDETEDDAGDTCTE